MVPVWRILRILSEAASGLDPAMCSAWSKRISSRVAERIVRKMKLKNLFPGSAEFGDGIACASSPFAAFFVLDFYDGPIEGFARISDGEHLVYFTKIWWDDHQNNRLFDAYIIAADDLRKLDERLYDEVQKGLSDHSSIVPDGEKSALSPIKPLQLLAGSPEATRINIFCENIAGGLFVRPVGEE